MKKFLKDNWFVAVIAGVFLVMTIYVSIDQHKDDVKGKKENGKDVIFSIDDKNFTADDLYQGLYDNYGKYLLTEKIMDAILDEHVPTTDAIINETNSYVQYYTQYYSYYGGIDYLNSLANTYGYDKFSNYMLYSVKSRELSSQYISEHVADYVNDNFLEKYNPRIISYVLIKNANAESATADEVKRLEAAKAAWDSEEYNAENFADFAKKYSEDESTASLGGILGYTDSKSSLDAAFLKAALELKEGEVSEWIKSDNFGYFLIKCESVAVEDFKKESEFVSRVLSEYEDASNKIMAHYYLQSKDITFTDEATKEYFLNQLGIKEEGGNE